MKADISSSFQQCFFMAWRNNSKEDIQQKYMRWTCVFRCSSVPSGKIQNTAECCGTLDMVTKKKKKEIPKLVLGKYVNLSFFRHEKLSWFSKLSGPQYPTVPSKADIGSASSSLRGCERRCSPTTSTSLCQLKLKKKKNWGHVSEDLLFFLFYRHKRQKNRSFSAMLTCARCFMLPGISDSCGVTAPYHVDLERQHPKSCTVLIFFYKCHWEGQN